MSFPRYAQYKDSGVDWLGQVPAHWEVKPVKTIALVVNGYPFDSKLFDPADGYPLVRIRDLDCDLTEARYRGGFVEAAAITSSDVLIGMDGEFNVGRWRGQGVALLNQRMCCVRARTPLLTRLLEYALPIPLKAINDVTYSTTVKHLASSDVEKTRIALPSDETEQREIAGFLDRETGKIDALVAEQERLLELLKEKRQAVISHAVTRGLNPNAPLKPSGLAWLGDVPAHWKVGKLGYAAKLRGGFAFSAADFGQDGVAVVRMNNLRRGHLDLTEAARIPDAVCEPGAALSEGDLLWGMSGSTGETGSLGNFARVRADDLPCQLNQRVGRFVADPASLDVTYLEWLIQTSALYDQVLLLVTGTAQSNISSEQVQSCMVALPPPSEQRAIVAHLDAATAQFDALTAAVERALALLQERRTALISAAVTGQIDVRSAALQAAV